MTSFIKSVFGIVFVLTVSLATLYGGPLGYGSLGSVQQPGADGLSVQFNNFSATTLSQYLNIVQPAGVNGAVNFVNTPTTSIVTNITNITSGGHHAYDVRFYFIQSSAGYNNSIAYTPTAPLTAGQNAIVFPNANTSGSLPNGSNPSAPYGGMTRGQFVAIGEVPGGTPFNLALLPNAANLTTASAIAPFWTNSSLNSGGDTGISHVQIAQFLGTNYYLLAWEDLPKGQSDFDYNDVIMVAEVIPLPEPSVYILGAIALFIVAFLKSRKTAKKAV